jgi:hypothetical protein
MLKNMHFCTYVPKMAHTRVLKWHTVLEDPGTIIDTNNNINIKNFGLITRHLTHLAARAFFPSNLIID